MLTRDLRIGERVRIRTPGNTYINGQETIVRDVLLHHDNPVYTIYELAGMASYEGGKEITLSGKFLALATDDEDDQVPL